MTTNEEISQPITAPHATGESLLCRSGFADSDAREPAQFPGDD
jgi:hypothetical protein